jgi:hypothetical protein
MDFLINFVSSVLAHCEHVKLEDYITKSDCVVSFKKINAIALIALYWRDKRNEFIYPIR